MSKNFFILSISMILFSFIVKIFLSLYISDNYTILLQTDLFDELLILGKYHPLVFVDTYILSMILYIGLGLLGFSLLFYIRNSLIMDIIKLPLLIAYTVLYLILLVTLLFTFIIYQK